MVSGLTSDQIQSEVNVKRALKFHPVAYTRDLFFNYITSKRIALQGQRFNVSILTLFLRIMVVIFTLFLREMLRENLYQETCVTLHGVL